MPMKPGASYRDKNRIRTLFNAGKSVEEIAATVNVAVKAVVNVCKQVQDGSLRLGPPPIAGERDRTPPGISGTPQAGSYGEGEEDVTIPHLEPGAVQRKLEDHENAEVEELKRQLAEANAENEELKAGSEEAVTEEVEDESEDESEEA